MELFAPLPEDLSQLSVDDLESYAAAAKETADKIAANPAEFLSDDRDIAALKAEVQQGVANIKTVKAEIASRAAAEAAEPETVEVDEAAAAELAALAAEADDEEDEVDEADEPAEEAAAEVETAEVEEVTAAASVVTPAVVARARQPRPARSRAATPEPEEVRVALTAAAEGLGFHLGAELPDDIAIAQMMVQRRGQFGSVPEGTHGDRIPIARADWSSLYGPDRTLSFDDISMNMEKIEAVTASAAVKAAFDKRRAEDDSLTASGGLCAPVTPYYQLQMLSQASRPVRDSLPAFNADRGGIKAASPASLGTVLNGTAVGTKTSAQDAAGGTFAQKTCQIVPCPSFTEYDIEVVYHCLQFGNLVARTFPELVAQWNSLTLAAHARTAETLLLDGIASASTHVTAADLGLGASAALPGQILAAAQGMRSRHRMTPDAVLRVQLPSWILDLLVSDNYRTQFQRFDMGPSDFVRILRAGNVEPTFYQDSATGDSQVFGTQTAAALLSFPHNVVWYLYPEGSFLYLDGGVLELGLVRDSVLNKTNDFQIFGETFENVAYVGVEALKVTSAISDTGTVSLPHATTDPVSY